MNHIRENNIVLPANPSEALSNRKNNKILMDYIIQLQNKINLLNEKYNELANKITILENNQNKEISGLE